MSTPLSSIQSFLQSTFANTQKKNAVIAVSGGIDSAVSLSLLVQALPKQQIWPILLPYGRQDMTDAETILNFWQIPTENRKVLNITSMVDAICKSLQITDQDKVRKGNVMARMRMIVIFDYAKNKDALVVGTENKSEHYLGYFTRFGDQASDLEPLATLYKTQVRQLAQALNLPEIFLAKTPSADLWQGQSDEQELGFSYDLADQVLTYLIDQKLAATAIPQLFHQEQQPLVNKILARVEAMAFKQQVPYSL
jgi:NAD+ synthase